MVQDTKELIKTMKLACKKGVNILPSPIGDLHDSISEAGQGVFDYMGANHCHKMKETDLADSVFFYSRADFKNTIKLFHGKKIVFHLK